MARIEANKDLGKILLDEGLIREDQLSAARAMQLNREKSIGRILTEMGIITEQAKIAFLNKKFNYEIVNIRDVKIPVDILGRLSVSYAEKFCCVPLLVEGGKLVVAMEDPTDIIVLDEIKSQTGMEPHPVLAPQADIEQAIQQYPRLTQAQADAIFVHTRVPLWLRVLRPLLFWMIIILPLVGFWLGVLKNDQFGNMVGRIGRPFDISLYLVLTWALWSIFIWEIDGLFFSSDEPRKKK